MGADPLTMACEGGFKYDKTNDKNSPPMTRLRASKFHYLPSEAAVMWNSKKKYSIFSGGEKVVGKIALSKRLLTYPLFIYLLQIF